MRRSKEESKARRLEKKENRTEEEKAINLQKRQERRKIKKRTFEKVRLPKDGTCKICNNYFENLSNHITYKHVKQEDIPSSEDYYLKYVSETGEKPICLNCKGPVQFVGITRGYKRCCCHECAMNAPEIKANVQARSKEGTANMSPELKQEVREKVKKTNLDKFGAEVTFQSEIIKEKIRQQNMKEYGVKSYSQTEEYKEQVKKTNLEKYGTEWQIGSKKTQDKIKQTNLEKHGVEYPMQSPEIREKAFNTAKENGGFTYQRPELRERIKETNLKNLGVEYSMQVPELVEQALQSKLKKYGSKNNIDKIKKTNLERYKVENVFQVPEIFEKAQRNNKLRPKSYTTNIKDEEVGYLTLLEKRFIDYCNSKNILIENGDRIQYFDEKNKEHFYFCDFKILEKDNKWRLVETKGYHKWWKRDLESGLALRKIKAAMNFTKTMGYHDYLLLLSHQIKKNHITKLDSKNTIYNLDIQEGLFINNKIYNTTLTEENSINVQTQL